MLHVLVQGHTDSGLVLFSWMAKASVHIIMFARASSVSETYQLLLVKSQCVDGKHLFLVSNDLATYLRVLYSMYWQHSRRAPTTINILNTQSARTGEGPQTRRTGTASVVHVDRGHPHPASSYTFAAPLHVTVHVFGFVVSSTDPVET